MYFKQFLDERCGCASYLIASRQTREAAIVDPSLVTDHYEAILSERDFTLRYVIDTHTHADHVSGARWLAAKYDAELCLHETARIAYLFRGLHDGEELPLGQLRLRIVHTPGHRPELISILIINPERSPEPSMVLTGDSLLVGDVGRPDFGGGDATEQYESLNRLLRLPDWVAVFPGHFEGPCGKGMCGRPSTTIGFERLFNPLARLDRPQFIATLNDGIPARPLNMVAIEATNRGAVDHRWAMLTTISHIDEIEVDQLQEQSDRVTLIDVREPEEFAHGHVPGAINIPQAEIATRFDEIPRDRPVATICHAGYRSYRTAQFFVQQGIVGVLSVRGGTEAWRQHDFPLITEDDAPVPRVIQSEWAHAGSGVYAI